MMDKELIERLAREAGLNGVMYVNADIEELQAFAALIAEECAKIVEGAPDNLQDSTFSGAARAIRAEFKP